MFLWKPKLAQFNLVMFQGKPLTCSSERMKMDVHTCIAINERTESIDCTGRRIKSHCTGYWWNHIAWGHHFDSICFSALFAEVIYMHQRQQSKTKEAQMGDGSRWLNADTASAKETISLQYNASLISLFSTTFLLKVFLHHDAPLFLRFTSRRRWDVGPLKGWAQCSDPSVISNRSSKQSSGNMAWTIQE